MSRAGIIDYVERHQILLTQIRHPQRRTFVDRNDGVYRSDRVGRSLWAFTCKVPRLMAEEPHASGAWGRPERDDVAVLGKRSGQARRRPAILAWAWWPGPGGVLLPWLGSPADPGLVPAQGVAAQECAYYRSQPLVNVGDVYRHGLRPQWPAPRLGDDSVKVKRRAQTLGVPAQARGGGTWSFGQRSWHPEPLPSAQQLLVNGPAELLPVVNSPAQRPRCCCGC